MNGSIVLENLEINKAFLTRSTIRKKSKKAKTLSNSWVDDLLHSFAVVK